MKTKDEQGGAQLEVSRGDSEMFAINNRLRDELSELRKSLSSLLCLARKRPKKWKK